LLKKNLKKKMKRKRSPTPPKASYYFNLIDHYGEEIRRFKRENPEYTFYQAMLYIKSKYGFPNSNQSIHESRKK
jgi:hypothetical protein